MLKRQNRRYQYDSNILCFAMLLLMWLHLPYLKYRSKWIWLITRIWGNASRASQPGLPCVHKLKEIMEKGNGSTQLREIHAHWRYNKPAAFCTRNTLIETEGDSQSIDPLLAVYEPTVVARSRGRPTDPRELPTTKTQQTSNPRVLRGGSTRGKGRGRGKGWGPGRGRGSIASSASTAPPSTVESRKSESVMVLIRQSAN